MSSQIVKPRFITRVWVSGLIVLLAWLLNQQFFLWPPQRMVEIDHALLIDPEPDNEWEFTMFSRHIIFWLVRQPIGMLINMLIIANTLLSMRAVLPRWYWRASGALFGIGLACSFLFGSLSVLTVALTIMIAVLVLCMLPGARYYYADASTGAYKGEAYNMNIAQKQSRDDTIIGLLIAYVPFVALGLLTHVVTFGGMFH